MRARGGPGFRSVRTRLMVWNIGIVALVLGAMGALVSYLVRAKLMSAVETEMRMQASRTGPPPHPGGGPDGDHGPFDHHRFDGMPPGERGPAGMHSSRMPRVFDLDGRARPPFDTSSPWDYQAFSGSASGREVLKTIQVDDEPVRLLSIPQFAPPGPPRDDPDREPPPAPARAATVDGRRIVGVVQVVYPLADMNRSVDELNGTLITLVPVALGLAGLGGAWLTDRALRPVREITRTAARIGAQDLSQRLPLRGGDEFAELAGTMNGMLSRLESAFAHLAELVENQRRFTADASHELKTPLTIIKANSSLALATHPDRESYHETIEEIDRAANTMSRLVQDLLLLARADEARSGQHRTSIPIPELLRGVALAVQRPGGIAVAVEAHSASASVLCNVEEITRVLINLLENALRHTPPDGRISLASRSVPGGLAIVVADTGAGIAAEHLPHVFERFYRADRSRARAEGGSGLGLAICKSLVEANAGQLEIASEQGVGTRVTVTLPAATAETLASRT